MRSRTFSAGTIREGVTPARHDSDMGVKNKQRRAAKQKRRAQHIGREPRGPVDERALFAELLWAAVDAVRAGDAAEAAELLGFLDAAPAAYAAIAADAVAQQRALTQRHGWSDDDLAAVEARRLKVAAGASTTERDVRVLALLASLPPLPEVEPRRTEANVDDGMLAKIRALLAKAESTTFPEEAESLSAKAQELMARHRIDHVLLDPGTAEGPVGRRIWLDDPYADAKARLLAEVAAANKCRSVLLTGLGCAHVVGFATDLEVVELLHTSLLVQATTAMAAAGPQRDARGRSRTRSFRQSFLIAYAWRVGQRLRETTAEAEHQAAAEHGDLLPALARRERRVEDEVGRAFPHAERKTYSVTNPAGWTAGTVAADAADLAVGPRLRE
jgi:hypothetical protein